MSENENMNLEPDEDICVTLELDDGEELECAVLTIFPVGEHDYIALLPLEGEYAEEGEVFLYRYTEDENGEPSLDNIADDDEYDAVSDAFDELLDSQQYDELVEAGDLEDIEEE
ncbi:MAG: DUF1292 domain-containing protein [Lachnospiraceae bacterium]|nr:DUF1292 domain-containing protein [Lachnospiraceae bacterium]